MAEDRTLSDQRLVAVLDRLFSTLDARERLHDVQLTLERMLGEQRTANAKVEGLMKTVYGNGTPGLKTDVDRLVQDLLDRRWRDRALWTVVLTTAGGLVLLLIRVFLLGGPS